MYRSKKVLSGLVTTVGIALASFLICNNAIAQLPAMGARGLSGNGSPSPSTQISDSTIGTCSNCLKTIRGRHVNRTSCPHCGIRWTNASTAAPSPSRSNQVSRPMDSPWDMGQTAEVPRASLFVLLLLLGGIFMMVVVAGIIFVVVKASIADSRRYGRKRPKSSYNRYRGS